MTRPVLDPDVLDRLRALNVEGEPDMVAEVLALFLEDTPPRLAAIRAAAAAANATDLQRAAHGLKGSAGNVGALAMHRLCDELEQLGRLGAGVEDVPALVAHLDAAFALVREAAAREMAP